MANPNSNNHNPWDRPWNLPPSLGAKPVRTGPEEDPLRELSLRGYTPGIVEEVHGVSIEQLTDPQKTALDAGNLAISMATERYGIGLDGKPMPPRRQE